MLQHFHCLKSRLPNSSNGGYSTRSRSHHNNLRHLHRNYQAFPQSRRTWLAQPTSRNPGAITFPDVSSKRKITISEKSATTTTPHRALVSPVGKPKLPQSISPHYPTPSDHVLPSPTTAQTSLLAPGVPQSQQAHQRLRKAVCVLNPRKRKKKRKPPATIMIS
jgi:hypothetical protein